MGAFKTLYTKDTITTPFVVNKSFTFFGLDEFRSSGIDFLEGKQIQGTFSENAGGVTGILEETSYSEGFPFKRNIYASARQLFYGNHTSSSYASGSFIESFGNTISSSIFFPTSSIIPEGGDAVIAVISIPRNLYGDYILPGTFLLDRPNETFSELIDDKEGNILLRVNDANQPVIGNIFYSQGIITITKNGVSYLTDSQFMEKFTNENNINKTQISFKSSVTLYETQLKCSIRESEFNYSYNPSLLATSQSNPTGLLVTESREIKLNEDYKSFVTGSDFSPYVTTVGLYNNDQELLAIAKLAQPLPTSQITDTTILVNIDR